jgi:hypothetical protein
LLQSHRQKIDFTSRILRRWKKLAKSIFSMRIWVVKKLLIFFNWLCNLRRFLSTRSIWVEIEASTKNAYSILFFFQRFMWKRFIFLFFWLLKRIASWSNRIEFVQNARRIIIEDVSCRSIVVWFTHASIRSKWIYAFEVFQNRCSVYSLLIYILYEWCSTCLRFARNI